MCARMGPAARRERRGGGGLKGGGGKGEGARRGRALALPTVDCVCRQSVVGLLEHVRGAER